MHYPPDGDKDDFPVNGREYPRRVAGKICIQLCILDVHVESRKQFRRKKDSISMPVPKRDRLA